MEPQERLGRAGRGATLEPHQLAHDAVRPKRFQEIELRAAGRLGAAIHQVDDRALGLALDGGMGLVDEALQAFGKPMVAPGLAARAVHALLHHHPMAVVGDDEAVQIEIETVLHGGAVDLRHQPARRGQGRAVKSDAIADRHELAGRLPRVLAAPAADVNAELVLQRREPALQRLDPPLVVMPEECQSIPITAPKDWNQKGCASRRSSSSRP